MKEEIFNDVKCFVFTSDKVLLLRNHLYFLYYILTISDICVNWLNWFRISYNCLIANISNSFLTYKYTLARSSKNYLKVFKILLVNETLTYFV